MSTMLNSDSLARKYIADHPGTSLTRNAIKVMLRSGCVPAVRAGNRVFYGYEAFLSYLEHGDLKPLDSLQYGKIRQIV